MYAGVKLSRVLVKMRNVNPLLVEAVHEYWVQKRIKRGHIPLMKEFDPAILMLSHPTIKRHPKATNDRTGYKKLRRLRYDLERARNMLELVRQRERAKLCLIENAERQFDVCVEAARRMAKEQGSAQQPAQAPQPAEERNKEEASLYSPSVSPVPPFAVAAVRACPSPRLLPLSQTPSDSEDSNSPTTGVPEKRVPLSQLTTSTVADSSVDEEHSSASSSEEQEEDDKDSDAEEDDTTTTTTAEPAAPPTTTAKAAKRPPRLPAPFLRLYVHAEEEKDEDEGADEDDGAAADDEREPQRRVVEVNNALFVGPDDVLVPPPRGSSWVVGLSAHASALPVDTARLSAKQRAAAEQQRSQHPQQAVAVLFPVNSDAQVQTGELPPPFTVKPTSNRTLLAVVERLHLQQHEKQEEDEEAGQPK